MKIELDGYLSDGMMQKTMDMLMEMLYECTGTVDIEVDDPSDEADVHLVCFDVRKNTCPFSVIEWIERLEGKKILMVGFSALGSIEGYLRRIESQILPFLPDDCDYKGMYLCPSAMKDEELSYLEKQMTQNGKTANIDKLKEMAQTSLSHPDEKDLRDVQRFVFEKLGYI